MNILVLNSGSSSLKLQIINIEKNQFLLHGHVDGIGLETCTIKLDNKTTKQHIKNHNEAISYILNAIKDYSFSAVAHRVVHGGEYYKTAVKIDAKVIKRIEQLSELAPLHNPPNLAGILACKEVLGNKFPQIAVFDTAFHQTIPDYAFMYGLPYEYYTKYKIRKYGFHGTSHKYVMQEACTLLRKKKANLITCHIGNGSSITAIQKNISIDTTMGFTPLQGVIMGTRSGDIDPDIVSYLQKKEKFSFSQIETVLNKKSGLKGIGGLSDMRLIREKALKGDKHCILAINMLAYDIATYIGAYAAIIGQIDGIVFTAGLGENAYYLRQKVLEYLKPYGVQINIEKNKETIGKKSAECITQKKSSIPVFVIPTNEELQIAREAFEILKQK